MNNVDLNRYKKRIVQALWDPEPTNDSTAPIWCLGCSYNAHQRASEAQPYPTTGTKEDSPLSRETSTQPGLSRGYSTYHEIDAEEARDASAAIADPGSWPIDFLDDFEARIWLTYRSSFTAIPKSDDPKAASGMSLQMRLKSQMISPNGFTSDTGWGCMIRSGQSLLVNAMAILRLGREWRRGADVIKEKELIRLFADDPKAPFSIHRFVEHGAAACGTFPGQWFGPSATAKCIEALSVSYRGSESSLRVYVTGDGPDVYADTLMRIAHQDAQEFQPTLLLVGTRLGIDRVTPVYGEALKDALCMPQSIGIAGGRPSSSHYFVGVQGMSFIYLDPHQTRPALPYHNNANDYSGKEIDSCHTRRIRRIPLHEMDPSMLIAFLFRNKTDWLQWREHVAKAPGKAIFHVADTEPDSRLSDHERQSALDDVETFDDENEDDITIVKD